MESRGALLVAQEQLEYALEIVVVVELDLDTPLLRAAPDTHGGSEEVAQPLLVRRKQRIGGLVAVNGWLAAPAPS